MLTSYINLELHIITKIAIKMFVPTYAFYGHWCANLLPIYSVISHFTVLPKCTIIKWYKLLLLNHGSMKCIHRLFVCFQTMKSDWSFLNFVPFLIRFPYICNQVSRAKCCYDILRPELLLQVWKPGSYYGVRWCTEILIVSIKIF